MKRKVRLYSSWDSLISSTGNTCLSCDTCIEGVLISRKSMTGRLLVLR
jgi:hypothetical protein